MSFEDRVRYRIVQSAEQLKVAVPIEVESALSNVRTNAARRQRRQVVAVAAATVAIAVALAARDDIGRLFLGDELRPKPADEQHNDSDVDESERNSKLDYQVLDGDESGKSRALGAGLAGESSSNLRRAPWDPDDRATGVSGESGGQPGSVGRSDDKQSRRYAVVDPVSSGTACWATGDCPGTVQFTAEHRWVSIRIEDDAGQNVSAWVGVDRNGDGTPDTSSAFCNSTKSPIRVRPGDVVYVSVSGAGCPNTGEVAGRPTSGEIIATFTR